MNTEDEREFLRRSTKLMGMVGPSGFRVLAYLYTQAERVDGYLVANTTYRSCGEALGMGPATAGRMFEVLLRHGIIAGVVSPQGCRFKLPESVFDPSRSGVRNADQAV
ncbi:MAG: hypothetical protein WAS75_14665 [Candidatus Microthrix subdominans]